MGLHEVARRVARRSARTVHPRAYQQLRAARPRHRHIRQAALLALRVLAQARLVVALQPLLESGGRLRLALHVQVEVRQVHAVAAQRVGQCARVAHPPRVRGRTVPPVHGPPLRMRGEHAVVHREDDDPVPFQALGGVDRHDLHGLRVRLRHGGLQSVLPLVRHVQVREERGQGGARHLRLVGGRHVHESVQGRPPARRQRVGDHVVEDPHDGDRALHLLHDRAARARAHRAQPRPQGPHAAHRLPADRRAPPRPAARAPPRLRRVVHGVQQHRPVGVAPLLAGQMARPVAQRHQVGGAQVDARQQPRQPRRGLHVVGQHQGRARVLHGRLVQQAPQADDLRRHARLPQSHVHVGEVGAPAAQDRGGGPFALPSAPRPVGGHEVHDRAQGRAVVLRVGDVHPPLPRPRPGAQHRGLGGPGVLAQGCGHAVRGPQDVPVVAPRGRQGEGLARLGGPVLEAVEEALQGRGRRAPPPVDRLVRVAHRRDGVVVEEQGQQLHLDDGGVLELVEEHRLELVAHLGAHRRGPAHDAGGEHQLVGEVQQAPLALAALELLDGPQVGEAPRVRPQGLARGVVRGADLLQVPPEPLQGVSRLLHRVAVLADLPRQVQAVPHHRRRRQVLVEVGGPPLDDLRHEVHGARLGEHREVRVDADPHAVLGDDALGEGVVGEGHGVLVEALAQ